MATAFLAAADNTALVRSLKSCSKCSSLHSLALLAIFRSEASFNTCNTFPIQTICWSLYLCRDLSWESAEKMQRV